MILKSTNNWEGKFAWSTTVHALYQFEALHVAKNRVQEAYPTAKECRLMVSTWMGKDKPGADEFGWWVIAYQITL